MPKLTPYVEIALTFAVLAFLVFVIAGGFNRSPDDIAVATTRPLQP